MSGSFHVSDTKQYLIGQEGNPEPHWTVTNKGPELIGQPENPPTFLASYLFDIKGQSLVFEDEPVQAGTESGKFEARRPLKIISPVSLKFGSGVALFAPGAKKNG